jgi:hypothetical protein
MLLNSNNSMVGVVQVGQTYLKETELDVIYADS